MFATLQVYPTAKLASILFALYASLDFTWIQPIIFATHVISFTQPVLRVLFQVCAILAFQAIPKLQLAQGIHVDFAVD